MIDLHPILAELLSPIARVELSYPDTKARFPLITITELSSISEVILDGEERLNTVSWQIDVWDGDGQQKRCAELATKASKAMIQAGFSRYFSQVMRDPNIPERVCMRFRGSLDEKNMMIYRS